MNRIRLLTIIGVGTFFAAALYFMVGKSPFPAIGTGAVLALLALAVTSLPKRRQGSSNAVDLKPKRHRAVESSSPEPPKPGVPPVKNGSARHKRRKRRTP